MSERASITAKTPEAKSNKPASKSQETDFSQSTNFPADHILFLQRTIGNQAVQRLFKSGVIQAKLRIGQPGDIYEKEADRVADAVIRMPEPQVQRQVEEEEEKKEKELIQTKPIADQITPLVQKQVEEEEEEKEEEILQTKQVSSHTPAVTPNLESRIHALKRGGQPLPESARAFFEPRFGYDFSQVRVHTDARAARTAQEVNSQAFTIGKDIAFSTGRYAPSAPAGQRLLAHELTHVVQQTSGNIVQRIRNETPNITRLREHLRDDQEDAAIGLMGRLSASEVQDVLASREFKELAISAFNNDEMYRSIRAMHGDLYPSLEWVFDEGTDWGKVKNIIGVSTWLNLPQHIVVSKCRICPPATDH